MPSLIPRSLIKEILRRTDIVDIIETRIKLKRTGKNYRACCPFHEEKSPSFIVTPEKDFFYCFGCHAHGNIIDFLMQYEGMSFIETIEELAAINSIKISETQNISHKRGIYDRKNNYNIMGVLKEVYKNYLSKQVADRAYAYLKKRNIEKKEIHQFEIGYAPNFKIDYLLKILHLDKKSYQFLSDAGIIFWQDKKGYQNFFRNRIVFPIHDRYGRVVAFGGRTFENDILPKYLNSPESNIFKKRCHLYGLYEAQKISRSLNKILVVEGYTDVISLTKNNILYSVATLGSTITSSHFDLLFRVTSKVIFCYDGDSAGRNAAWRTLQVALKYMQDSRQIYFMFLPENEDPDTLIRKEKRTNFERRINKASTLAEFLFDTLIAKVNLRIPENRVYLGSLALPFIKEIPGLFLRNYLYQKLERITGILGIQNLENLSKKEKKIEKKSENSYLKPTAMRILIGSLIQYPYFFPYVPSSIKTCQYNIPGLHLVQSLVSMYLSEQDLTTGKILEYYRNKKELIILKKLAIWRDIVNENIAKEMFLDSIQYVLNSILRLRQEELLSNDRLNQLDEVGRKELWMIEKRIAKK